MADMTIRQTAAEQPNLTPEQIRKQKKADAKLRKVCADFESIFTYNLMKSMRKSIPDSGFLNKSSSRQNWEMLMDQKIADSVSQKGRGLGLQTMLYNQMKKKLKISV
jgi:peptidoglycan hydrolase FlgJ